MKIKIGNKTFEVSSEELEGNPQEITIPFEGTIRNEDEEGVYYNNLKKEFHKAGTENAVKQYREEYGFEGRSIEKLIEAVKSKTLEEAKLEPNEKIKKITETLEAKELALQNALQKSESVASEFQKYKDTTTISQANRNLIPKNALLDTSDMLTLLSSKINFKVENGVVVGLDKAGNIITDKTTGNPETHENLISSFFQNNQQYLKPVEGGAGGGDSANKGGKMTTDQFIEQLESKSEPVYAGSTEFQEQYNEAVKNGLIED